MSLSTLMTKPCTITRRSASSTLIDASGDAVISTATVVTVCEIQRQQRRSESEPADQGELSDTHWDLFLPWGTALDTSDKVAVGGQAYEVVGAPWNAQTGSPRMWHVAASVRRTAGAGDAT